NTNKTIAQSEASIYGKTHGRVSVLANRQTQRMNPNGAVFLKFVTGKPTAELAEAPPLANLPHTPLGLGCVIAADCASEHADWATSTCRLSRTRLPPTTV
ncbi:hypothetical protein, partial [uncultured Limnobacter sp.]|uniref:hypothetical protein n=2 Tax=Limnobacter TaxID=131079 RepID=UPI0025FC0BEB